MEIRLDNSGLTMKEMIARQVMIPLFCWHIVCVFDVRFLLAVRVCSAFFISDDHFAALSRTDDVLRWKISGFCPEMKWCARVF